MKESVCFWFGGLNSNIPVVPRWWALIGSRWLPIQEREAGFADNNSSHGNKRIWLLGVSLGKVERTMVCGGASLC